MPTSPDLFDQWAAAPQASPVHGNEPAPGTPPEPAPEAAPVTPQPLRRALQEQAAAAGVSDQVDFVGRLEHARVLAMMARAQLFALPSWDEAFGLVYTEAMAQGTPILALRGGGPDDFVEHGVSGGWLVPEHDPDAIADVIRGVLDDPAQASAIGDRGRATALGLSWTRNAESTLAVYTRVLGPR